MTLLGILSAYRCRECRTLFRGVSRDLQMGFAILLTVAVLSASVFYLWVRQVNLVFG